MTYDYSCLFDYLRDNDKDNKSGDRIDVLERKNRKRRKKKNLNFINM